MTHQALFLEISRKEKKSGILQINSKYFKKFRTIFAKDYLNVLNLENAELRWGIFKVSK